MYQHTRPGDPAGLGPHVASNGRHDAQVGSASVATHARRLIGAIGNQHRRFAGPLAMCASTRTKHAHKNGSPMTTYSVTRTIDAPAERVWALLTDASGYTTWNPTIVSLEGSIAEGNTIALVSTLNPKRTFKLKVSDVEPPRSMIWSDGMPLGLFQGVRTFTLDKGEGATTFTMEEAYSGLLEPLISKSIPDMTGSFEEFADGLKQASEAS